MQLDCNPVQRDWERAMARHLAGRPPGQEGKRLERERVRMLMDLHLAAKREREQLALDQQQADYQYAQECARRL
jgi:hypothetical protein